MASVDEFPSPESTVTTLLASSGRLRSSLNPEPFCPIKYKDRPYESASDALEAYIADFQIAESSVGRLELFREQNKHRLVQPGYRNRDVLKESLTDRELDFLNLPISSKHRTSDHLSVTTDDLLVLPGDGSLPVTRTSALLCRLANKRLQRSADLNRRSQSRSALAQNKSLNYSSASRTLFVEDLLTGSLRSACPSFFLNSLQSTSRNKEHSPSSYHLPRWMTSQKSEMDFSGVTSIPDLKYPAWLEQCSDSTGPQSVPFWVSELQKNTDEGQEETESYKKVKSGGYGMPDDGEPFRGDKIDSLIQRAEEVLKSPSLGFSSSDKEQHGSPGNTEEVLEADRLWENPHVTFKSPVPVGSTEEQITAEESSDAREKSLDSLASGYSRRKHPGPVEALKQMLYSLQAVEQKVTLPKEEFSGTALPPLTMIEKDNEEVSRPDGYDSAPGGQSLKRALHHLGRLKSLVNEKKPQESYQGVHSGAIDSPDKWCCVPDHPHDKEEIWN